MSVSSHYEEKKNEIQFKIKNLTRKMSMNLLVTRRPF